ncbi:hypothetical protein DM860_007249 [Cuscuta australis]|uniref:ACB domain-containing protein n=1 Tax=Cuscuta australis TaxID=267555 RepID=A0A328E2Z3_9ASTE|nr:hypothetical protein DM860_007249 [Cuscuta australis]
MVNFSKEFEEHATKAKLLPENTPYEDKLILYGLYKQATVGKVNTDRPGIFSMKERAKWDAWKAVKGIWDMQYILDAKSPFLEEQIEICFYNTSYLGLLLRFLIVPMELNG